MDVSVILRVDEDDENSYWLYYSKPTTTTSSSCGIHVHSSDVLAEIPTILELCDYSSTPNRRPEEEYDALFFSPLPDPPPPSQTIPVPMVVME
jgi:hypothetical protein